jgi:hypothetical protein
MTRWTNARASVFAAGLAALGSYGAASAQVNTGHYSHQTQQPGNPTQHNPFNGNDPTVQNWDWPASWTGAGRPATLNTVTLAANDIIWIGLDNIYNQFSSKTFTLTFTSPGSNFLVANRTFGSRPGVQSSNEISSSLTHSGTTWTETWVISPCPDWEYLEIQNVSGQSTKLSDLSWTSTKSPLPAPSSGAVLGCAALWCARRRRPRA